MGSITAKEILLLEGCDSMSIWLITQVEEKGVRVVVAVPSPQDADNFLDGVTKAQEEVDVLISQGYDKSRMTRDGLDKEKHDFLDSKLFQYYYEEGWDWWMSTCIPNYREED